MKFWFSGGHFSTISQHWKWVFIPPPTKLWGSTSLTTSGRMSVRLSLEKWFCTLTPLPFDVQYLYLPDQKWTSVGFGVKRSKVKIEFFYSFCTIALFSFCIKWWYFTHALTLTRGGTLLILVQKAKVIIRLLTLCRFQMITPFSFGTQCFYFKCLLTIARGRHLLIFESIGQRSRSNSDFKLAKVSAQQLFYLLTHNNYTSHLCCLWPFWFWGQEFKGKG